MRVPCFVSVILLFSAWSCPAPVVAQGKVLGDVLFVRKTKGDEEFPPAVFSHWKHRVKFKCFVCHSKEVGFDMKADSNPVTMAAINDGKYCGACHTGTIAFGVSFETCARCHQP